MKKRRTFCADSPYGDRNCKYAKVVEEEGRFPVKLDIVYPDGRENSCEFEVGCRYAAYCTHPKSKELFLGTVEPYGIVCEVPSSCPLTQKEKQKETLLHRVKNVFGKK